MQQDNGNFAAQETLKKLRYGFEVTKAYGAMLTKSIVPVDGTDRIAFTVPRGDRPEFILSEIFNKDIPAAAFSPIEDKADSYTVSASDIEAAPAKIYKPLKPQEDLSFASQRNSGRSAKFPSRS